MSAKAQDVKVQSKAVANQTAKEVNVSDIPSIWSPADAW